MLNELKLYLEKLSLYASVFVVGAATMALELLGFSIISPHFGNALAVSSNLISLVLLGLTLGYYYGGKRADKKASLSNLSYILFASALYLGVIFSFRDYISAYTRIAVPSVPLGSFLAIVVLFGPLSYLFGMVLPYAVKLSVSSMKKSGASAGKIYALSSLGSIVGTFAAGFILIPYLNIISSLVLIAGLLILNGVFLNPRYFYVLLAIPIFYFSLSSTRDFNFEQVLYSGNSTAFDGAIKVDREKLVKLDDLFSQYNRIRIYEGKDEASGRTLRLLRVNREIHSGSFLDSDELIFKYAQFNKLAGHFNSNAKKALLIGGGGFSYAKFFLGDTPLHDKLKEWSLNGKIYSNDNKLMVPILISSNKNKVAQKRVLVAEATSSPVGSEIEGTRNFVDADNQFLNVVNKTASSTVIAKEAEIYNTGLPCNAGYVHVHEISKNGIPEDGKIISANIPISEFVNKQGLVIGHSHIFSGSATSVPIRLDRKINDGEVLNVMLHRDNCNGRFDPVMVDGYEKIEKMDVVEIDPAMKAVAVKYFGLIDSDPRLRVIEEDGRTYINRTQEKYDNIYIDAMLSFYSMPYQLTTLEAVNHLYNMLNNNGVVVVNIPGALSGKYSKFFQAEYLTYKKVFPAVRAYAVNSPEKETAIQNIVLIAFKSEKIRETLNDDPAINAMLPNVWLGNVDKNTEVLTDDFAPVDYYNEKLVNIPTL